MGVSGERHAPGKGPQVPTEQEAGWTSEQVWKQRLEENLLTVPFINNVDFVRKLQNRYQVSSNVVDEGGFKGNR
jgi:hypothetical protein